MKLRLFRFLGLCLVMLGIIAFTPSLNHAAVLTVKLQWDPSVDLPHMGYYKIYWNVGKWTFTNVTDFVPPAAAYGPTAYSTDEGKTWNPFATSPAPPIENVSKDLTNYWLQFPDDSTEYSFAMTSVDTGGVESHTFSNVVSTFFTVNGVNPNVGKVSGGDQVTISGGGFLQSSTAPTTVTFGGNAATDVTVEYPTMITCTTPASTLGDGTGSVDVVVTNPDGQTATLKNGYEYVSYGGGAGEVTVSGVGGGGGCFIATAAYGTPFSKKVKILDQFRDVYLLPTKIGRDFVAFYYAHSPPLANYIAKRDGLRTLVRVMLTPVVGVCYVALHTNMTQKIMIFMGILLLLGAGLIVLRNRIHRKRMSS